MAKNTVVIVHGSFGDVKENWIPYIKENLSNDDCEVIVPQFPVGDQQNLENWKNHFRQEVGELDESFTLLGHSIAPSFFLSLLSSQKNTINGLILVSGFLHDLGVKEFDDVNRTFTHQNFDWDLIKARFNKGFAFHGEDDPYVPIWMGQELADNLGITLQGIEKGGHLNIAAGFKEFPQLLAKIREFLV